MKQYQDLLADVRHHGVRKPTRAKLRSTGQHVDALSVFARQIRFDLSASFPLVTTKRMWFDAIAHELVWFLKGATNVAYLQQHGITIWDEWADEEGDLGPIYGKQWRSWRASDGQSIDQISNVIAGILAVKGTPDAAVGRRLIVSAWNPGDISKMALPPCHVLFQFNVTGDTLSCQLYQRSADLFLGVPFNIASYALLTVLMAHITGLVPGEFIHTLGDCHIYVNHLDVVDQQLAREPLPLPNLEIDPELKHLSRVERDQIKLVNYFSYGSLHGEVAV